jgi:phosphoglycolate phosphatase
LLPVASAAARPEVVLLDFDGTIAATHPAVVECVLRTTVELGYGPIDREKVSAAIAAGLTLQTTFTSVIEGLTPHQLASCVDLYRETYATIDAQHSRLFEGVWTTLQRIHLAGVHLAVLSNKGPVAIGEALRRYRLAPFITRILGAEQGLPTKPDPALFELRVAPAFPSVPRSDFLMVGDTIADIRFAKTIGVRSCWASYGYGDPLACRQLAPDYEIGCFSALLSVLGLVEQEPQFASDAL